MRPRDLPITLLALMVLLIASRTPAQAADGDGDGIDQTVDICLGVPDPLQTDSDGDGSGNACDGDFDNNGSIGFGDFQTLLGCFGSTVGAGIGQPSDPICAESDMDANGTVGFDDFTRFLEGFGGPPGPSCCACGDGTVNRPQEQCDGGDDANCPGQCSSRCSCPSSHAFVIDPAVSAATVRGALGPDLGLLIGNISGTITLEIGAETEPGVFNVSVPTASLPPVDIFGLATACILLVEDPALLGSGISGTGLLNCSGADLADPPSPDFSIHADHCSGTAPLDSCDSHPAPADCPSPLGFGATVHALSGLCVPEAPPDPACVAAEPVSGTTALPDAFHIGSCNSPFFVVPGSAPWFEGDALIVLNLVLDIRAAADPCLSPPLTVPVRGAFTTGRAASTIMDAFATPGLVQAIEITGTRPHCPALLAGETAGISLVTSFPFFDSVILDSQPADLNVAVIFSAM